MRILDAPATRAALPFAPLIEALRRAFAGGDAIVPPRGVHVTSAAGAATTTSLVMPAWTPGGHYVVKIVNIAEGNAARGLAGLHATVLLHDAATGVPIALLDGDELTARRTAAASALGASYLAREDARSLLVVGAGRIAALLPEAYRCVRRIERVAVWARRRDEAERTAAAWRASGIAAHAADDLEAAIRAADIVSCATLAREPLVRGEWLAAGSHLDLVGSFTPQMREADDACFAGASIWVDTEEALAKSGDLLGPMSRGVFAASDVRGTLASLCRGSSPPPLRRAEAGERTVFKSAGTALEDLAAAVLAAGVGRPNPACEPRGGV